MMWNNYGMGAWGWGFGALVVIGVIILVVVLVRVTTSSRRRSGSPDGAGVSDSSAKRIVDERYAKGELTSDEYRERLATLGLKP